MTTTLPTTDLNFDNPSVQPVYVEGVPCAVIYNAAKTVTTQSWDSRDDFPNDIDTSNYRELLVFFGIGTITGGTAPTVTLFCEAVFDDGSANGVTFDIGDSGAQPALTNKFASIGPGCQFAISIGNRLRLAMLAAGNPTEVQFTIIVIAKG